MDYKKLEKYSCCFTLSDMEIFVFPELFYSLVLANILSPIIWKWEEDSWFDGIHNRSFNYKINRIKQYIISNYIFNLDLETWGLSDKNVELKRFENFIDLDVLQRSNALFGYEGDKYYFDIDIRKHFGLDKFTTDIIPYWKTETVEAMNAFAFKQDYNKGAGECVSLSALYAAALFIIGKISLENIFLIATPLHSQNFINLGKGVLTNNRRLVTKSMWFNGTTLSSKARRALENEEMTIVSHISGYIHTAYKKATIEKNSYTKFKNNLSEYLSEKVSYDLLKNFLREYSHYQKHFQYFYAKCGSTCFIELEKIFQYEHSSKYTFANSTEKKLLSDIDPEDFSLSKFEDRVVINSFADRIKEKNGSFTLLEKEIVRDFTKFLNTKPKFPSQKKDFITEPKLNISTTQTRDEIALYLQNQSETNDMAQLALYTFRQMDKIDWQPFLYAAVNRNPVSLLAFKEKSFTQCYEALQKLPNNSIYDGKRLAQPDEVWNFQTGDGVEKAILFANVLNLPAKKLEIDRERVLLKTEDKSFEFFTNKGFKNRVVYFSSLNKYT